MRTVTGATSGFYKPGRGRKARWVALAAMAFAAAIGFVWPDVEQARGSSLGPYHIMSAQEMVPPIFTAAGLGIAAYRLILSWPPRQRDCRDNS